MEYIEWVADKTAERNMNPITDNFMQDWLGETAAKRGPNFHAKGVSAKKRSRRLMAKNSRQINRSGK